MKAVALLSGGLDSTLATKLMQEQGIELLALNFKTPFCLCDGKSSKGCINHAKAVADNLGIDFKIINVTDDFLKILKKPKHGFGSGMNPCIDCRILKFRKAKEIMQETKASFIITGEVLGQRPMSQYKKALNLIDKESALEGFVLRPLSAKLLPETLPEKNGWVSRDKLLSYNGRTRKPQIALAKKFNIKDYPCPAGGCLLTDPGFARRLKDLLKYGNLDLNNIEFLKIGRHFRLNSEAKLIVGRDEKENMRLESLLQKDDFYFLPADDFVGPAAILRGGFENNELVELAVKIIVGHCDNKEDVKIEYTQYPTQNKKTIRSSSLEREKIEKLRI